MVRLLVFCCLVVSFALAQPAQAQSITALVGGTLIDGYGGPPLRNSVILVQGDRILEVGTTASLAVPAGAEVISTEGMSVLPGLWDMHVHLMLNGHSDYAHWHPTYWDRFEKEIMPASAMQLLKAGVTSVRDLGGPLEASVNVRDAINDGQMDGPTLYVSGPFLQHEPYPGTEKYRWGIQGPDDARRKVRRLVEGGVDVIKLIDQDQMTMEEIQAVVDEAHAHGKTVVAHGHRPEEIRRGLLAGVDCFEHTGLATAPAYPDDVIEMLRDRAAQMNLGPLFWTPTVTPLHNYTYLRDHPEMLDDPSWREGMPEDVVADIEQSISRPGELPYYQITPQRAPTLKTKFWQIRDAGVVQLIGTDSGVPMNFHSQTTWQELDAWVRDFGVPAMDVIRAATYWPSVMMGVSEEVGTVSAGKYADIIAVKGDVLRYINLLQDVDLVMKHGERYK